MRTLAFVLLSVAVVAVVGPTAAGKSELAVGLARRIGGEVVNADSMQLYRGMDVGTAKLPEAERRGVPHHLLDVWDVTRAASVADYQRVARAAIDDVIGRGATPLLVGGSGLYVRAVIDRLDFPGTDPQLRIRLEAELTAAGPRPLYDRLKVTDPAAAARIPATNGRRIVRALEVGEVTGAPYAVSMPPREPYYDVVQIGLEPPRADLDERIEVRVGRMFDGGLVEEVRRLEQQGLRDGPTASRALGYSHVLAMLDGKLTEAQARTETARATRRLARRQRSWFAADDRVRWLATADLAGALALLPAS